MTQRQPSLCPATSHTLTKTENLTYLWEGLQTIPQLTEDKLTWRKINLLSLSEVSKISSYTSRYTPFLLGLHRSGKLLPTAKPLPPLTIPVWAEISIVSQYSKGKESKEERIKVLGGNGYFVSLNSSVWALVGFFLRKQNQESGVWFSDLMASYSCLLLWGS